MYDTSSNLKKKHNLNNNLIFNIIFCCCFLTSFCILFQNTDASLLPTVCWPAFAIHEEQVRHRTIDKVIRKLKGNYGIKRFLRDGYKTVIEDKNRKYYRPAEIKVIVVNKKVLVRLKVNRKSLIGQDVREDTVSITLNLNCLE